VLDFTSSLYLGLRHPSRTLLPWEWLTTGIPAALREAPAAARVAAGLAELQRCERAILARSTLHGFVDTFEALVRPGASILVDAGAYPIARWGIERVAGRGQPVVTFAHHDPDTLERALDHPALRGRWPLVVCDGLCPGCGGAAPLAAYRRLAQRRGGLLIVDDTQALGVLGREPGPSDPYGHGGGGTPAWCGLTGPGVLAVSSLAKGFGVPIAVLAGDAGVIERIEAHGPTRSHASPPSAADLHAAAHALGVNARDGRQRRRRLAALVQRLRQRLAVHGVGLVGRSFPVQSLPAMPDPAAARLHDHLLAAGVRTVLQRPRCVPGATVTLLVSAGHGRRDVDRAADALAAALPASAPGARAAS
jgi:8-amino-7-oxononanoate synthase